MSWAYWGIVSGIISLVAVFLFAILTIYAGPRGSSSGKRLNLGAKPEPLVHRRAA